MIYRGQVRNGVIVFEEPVPLAEGTLVRVEAEQPADPAPLRRGLLALAGCVEGLPADLAENHDHYLYGTPKR